MLKCHPSNYVIFSGLYVQSGILGKFGLQIQIIMKVWLPLPSGLDREATALDIQDNNSNITAAMGRQKVAVELRVAVQV